MKNEDDFDPWPNIGLPHEYKDGLTFEQVRQFVEYTWDKIPKKNFVLGYTGKSGRIQQLEMIECRELTQEEKDSIPEGMYSLLENIPGSKEYTEQDIDLEYPTPTERLAEEVEKYKYHVLYDPALGDSKGVSFGMCKVNKDGVVEYLNNKE